MPLKTASGRCGRVVPLDTADQGGTVTSNTAASSSPPTGTTATQSQTRTAHAWPAVSDSVDVPGVACDRDAITNTEGANLNSLDDPSVHEEKTCDEDGEVARETGGGQRTPTHGGLAAPVQITVRQISAENVDSDSDSDSNQCADDNTAGRVLFEGAERYITAIAVNNNVTKVVCGRFTDCYNRAYEVVPLTIIFIVMGLVALFAFPVMLTQDVGPAIFYFTLAAVPMWLNMISSRSPEMMLRLFRFDFLFMSGNMIMFTMCLAWELGWDQRSMAVLVAILPTCWTLITADACNSDFEFNGRKINFAVSTVLITVIILLNELGLYHTARDPELIVQLNSGKWCMSPCNLTAANDTPWKTTSVYNLRSIGDMRGVYVLVYCVHVLIKSSRRPNECGSFDYSARRRWVSTVSEAESSNSSIQRPLNLASEAAPERADRSAEQGQEDAAVVERNRMDLNARSRRLVNSLEDDDMVILYAPVREFALTEGPAATFLCRIMEVCCVTDAQKKAAAVNLWMDDNRNLEEIAWLPLYILSFASMCNVIPHVFTYLITINLFDVARVLFRYNFEAMRLSTENTFLFWIPLVSATAAMAVAGISFGEGGDHGAQLFCFVTYVSFIVLISFADCDLSRKRVTEGPSHVVNFGALALFSMWAMFFSLGAFPTARNVVFTVRVGYRDVTMDLVRTKGRVRTQRLLRVGAQYEASLPPATSHTRRGCSPASCPRR